MAENGLFSCANPPTQLRQARNLKRNDTKDYIAECLATVDDIGSYAPSSSNSCTTNSLAWIMCLRG